MFRFFRKYHKWVGLFFSVFIILFAVSGIILNHRKAVSGISISRDWLPSGYQFRNWNNGAVKGAFQLSADSILLYGNAGIWLTDSVYSEFTDFSHGIKSGADNHLISKIMRTSNGEVFAAATFDLYRLGKTHDWENITIPGVDERLADLAIQGDSLLVMSRSHIYLAQGNFRDFRRIDLKTPSDYSPKVTLFRTLWLLHSGELFGLGGKLFVDLLGVLFILLCITGWLYMFLPTWCKRRKKQLKSAETAKRTLKWSIKWHNQLGYWLFGFFLLLSVTGMFLRPPLLIAIIRAKVSPVPGSVLSSDNCWHDKLRCIRFDHSQNEWLLYSSSGFYALTDWESQPQKIQHVPPVSVMGVSVLEPEENGWLVGSFSGLYFWNRFNNDVIDCYSGQWVRELPSSGRPVFDHPVTGLIGRAGRSPVVFEYDLGVVSFDDADPFVDMPQHIQDVKMSLWHTCLEIHVGRAYKPLIGPFSDMFVFLSGIILSLILISGYVVYRKRLRKK